MQSSAAEGWRARARPCFGSLLSIRARGLPRDVADAALTEAFVLAQRVHEAMSRQSPASDVAAISRLLPGDSLGLRPETRAVIALSLSIAEETQGLFDPVVPARGSRPASWHDVRLSTQGEVAVRRPLALSLDGIAKGYAADRICELLREWGAADVVVDAGGDLVLHCAEPERVGIRSPTHPRAMARIVEITRGGVASSGNYGGISQFWLRGGFASAWPRAVTVLAPDGATADALTKVVAAAEDTRALLARFGAKELLAGEPAA
jgi:thiamine biosynthesis lipoprotein